MHKGRLEAFSDGVMAIIITIMVLEIKVPHEGSWAALVPLVPKFLSYALSFTMVGIYWNNHHHLLQASKHVTGQVMWANHFLLFCLSLIPFGTAWMGETHFAKEAVMTYGGLLYVSGAACWLLSRALVRAHGANSLLAHAIGSDWKGLASLGLYLVSVPLALVHPTVSCGIYVLVALMWLVPDRRMTRAWTECSGS